MFPLLTGIALRGVKRGRKNTHARYGPGLLKLINSVNESQHFSLEIMLIFHGNSFIFGVSVNFNEVNVHGPQLTVNFKELFFKINFNSPGMVRSRGRAESGVAGAGV